MIIAIDGPAGSGKSTTARLVAQRLGYRYLDTGAMYRAIGLGVMRQSMLDNLESVPELLSEIKVEVIYNNDTMQVLLNGEDVTLKIRSADAAMAASHVSTLSEVRTMMVERQREIAREVVAGGSGVVMDGRDIGTDVFPDADLKIFMEADPEVRAQRRYAELRAGGVEVDLADIVSEINRRDQQDMNRAVSPFRKANDATVLDTSSMSIDQQVAAVLSKVGERGRAAAGRL